MIRKALGLAIGGVLVLALSSFAPTAHADAANQLTQFTFSQPIGLPGHVVLPAGTYWFILPESGHGDFGQVMQVLNQNGRVVDTVGMYDTSPLPRHDDEIDINLTNKPELTLANVSAHGPLMLVSWFYPDINTGHKLAYSAQERMRIAEGSKITVLANTPQGG